MSGLRFFSDFSFRISFGFLPTLLLSPASLAPAQDVLKKAPHYRDYTNIVRQAATAVKPGSVSVKWVGGGKAFEFTRDGKQFRYDIAAHRAVEIAKGTNGAPAATRAGRRGDRPEGPARGRQFSSTVSPDGKHTAIYKDHNVWLGDAKGSNAVAVTTNGSAASRIKFGSASWVYGEELYQTTALWWSSNSQRLAFYRFDESGVPEYFLALNQVSVQDKLDREAYPKAGGTNPVVDILVYDLASKRLTTIDVRDGKSWGNEVMGHYVYGISWSGDGKELLFHRTNRRQNIMELCAADPGTRRCRVIVREEWPQSWTENLPTMRFLKDQRRFIWSSDRTGWRNFYLYDLSGALLATLTHGACDVAEIRHVDEERGLLHYLAHDGDNPMKLQLHRVRLDGTEDRRLTDPSFHHTVDMAPDGKHFIDIAQTHDTPPTTRLMNAEGHVVDQIASSDMTRFHQLGLRTVELLKFKAADGTTDLYGLLHRPSHFNRWTKYPLLVSVYAGPQTEGARETFVPPSPMTELGFLMASFDSRSASGRGKRFLDAIYTHFGRAEIDDQAAGVRSLYNRWYVSEKRVGIFGTSYGGTASAMCLLRHPNVFQAACASSGVMDWRNYDTIYTERYMGLPAENKEAYAAGSVLTYATNLTGRLMVYYGTADNNVHPANSLQLIDKLQKAGRSFDVQVGPDLGHSGINRDRMMEFFVENLRKR